MGILLLGTIILFIFAGMLSSSLFPPPFSFVSSPLLLTGSAARQNAEEDANVPPLPTQPGLSMRPGLSSCNNGMKDGQETDADCGGSCGKCEIGKVCSINADCESDYCYVQTCRQKPPEKTTSLLSKEPVPENRAPENRSESVTVLIPPSAIPPPRAGENHLVSIIRRNASYAFEPSFLVIFSGDTLTWVNNDSVAHKPVSFDRMVESEKLFPGQTWTFTPAVGEVNYQDDLYPSTEGLWSVFKGIVVVKSWVGACGDRLKDLDESDVDCGGHCSPCNLGKACHAASDCSLHLCIAETCVSPQPVSCVDGLKNQVETGVDCGGSCQKCQDGTACATASDCKSSYCSAHGICLTPSCTDGENDQGESGVDCGGSCAPCVQGAQCVQDKDCITHVCAMGVCDIPTVDVQMSAKQFAFEPAVISAQLGSRIRINVTSIDVPHGFSLPAFNILRNLQPQKPELIEFIADKEGAFEFVCSVYCGHKHADMRGKVVISGQASLHAPAKRIDKEETVPLGEAYSFSSLRNAAPSGFHVSSSLWFFAFLLLGLGIIAIPRIVPSLQHHLPHGSYVAASQHPVTHPSKQDALSAYVNSMRKKGYGEKQIYHQLLRHGYQHEEAQLHVALQKESLVGLVKRMKQQGYAKEKIIAELLALGNEPMAVHEALEKSKW